MRRSALTLLAAGALMLPAVASAQTESPGTSPSPHPLGTDTMHVCLAINGPVTLLDAESLTQGIIDGTFVIEGLSTECEVVGDMASPAPIDGVDASPTTIEGLGESPGPIDALDDASPDPLDGAGDAEASPAAGG